MCGTKSKEKNIPKQTEKELSENSSIAPNIKGEWIFWNAANSFLMSKRRREDDQRNLLSASPNKEQRVEVRKRKHVSLQNPISSPSQENPDDEPINNTQEIIELATRKALASSAVSIPPFSLLFHPSIPDHAPQSCLQDGMVSLVRKQELEQELKVKKQENAKERKREAERKRREDQSKCDLDISQFPLFFTHQAP